MMFKYEEQYSVYGELQESTHEKQIETAERSNACLKKVRSMPENRLPAKLRMNS